MLYDETSIPRTTSWVNTLCQYLGPPPHPPMQAQMSAFAAPLPLLTPAHHLVLSSRAPACRRPARCTLQQPATVTERPRASERAAVLTPGFLAPLPPPRAAPPVVVVIPGYGAPASDYARLREELRGALGEDADVRVVPVTVGTWARTLGGRPVSPVLELVEATVKAAVEEGDGGKVTLVGHSAGGWIARIYLSRSAEYCGRVWGGAERVDKLVCLGTPQRSNEAVTKTNMMFVNEQCAGCAEDDVEYVCVAGTGLTFEGPGGGNWRFWEKGWLARVSYHITDVDGGALVGDGIVPTTAAYLDGAQNVELEGIWHSPASPGPWYGDERAIAYWTRYL